MSLPGNVIRRVTAVRPLHGHINDILWLQPSSTSRKGRLSLHLFPRAWKSRFDRISVQIYTVCGLEVNKQEHWCSQQTEVTSSSYFTSYPGMCSLDSSPFKNCRFTTMNIVPTHFCFSLWHRSLTFLFQSQPSCKSTSAGLPGQQLQIAHGVDGNSFMCVFIADTRAGCSSKATTTV